MAERQERYRWEDEDTYWRTNYRQRPYASTGAQYEFYRPAYRFGYDAASRYEGRDWASVEPELSRSWDTYEHRGESTWDHMKAAVRDAWDRITGNRTVSSR
jgi:hypothetical protein